MKTEREDIIKRHRLTRRMVEALCKADGLLSQGQLQPGTAKVSQFLARGLVERIPGLTTIVRLTDAGKEAVSVLRGAQ